AKSTAMPNVSGSTGFSLSSQITPGIAISITVASAISTGRNTDSTSLLNDRAESSPPSPCSRLENIGTKAAENAPSANRRRNTLGMMNAWNQASVTALAPSTREKIISRAIPAILLTRVSPPIVPTFLMRLICAASDRLESGVAGGGSAAGSFPDGSLLLLSGKLLHVKTVEIDRIEHQRGKARIAHGVGDHAPGEGEQQPRRFGIEEGMTLLVGDVLQPHNAAIGEVDDIGGSVLHLGIGGNLQFHFLHFFVDLARADIELHVEFRLVAPLEAFRRFRIFDRQVLHILREQAGNRQIVGAVGGLVGVEVGEDVAFFGHGRKLSIFW